MIALTGSQLVELQRRYLTLNAAIDAIASDGDVQAAPAQESALNEAYNHFQALAAELMPALMNAAADGIRARAAAEPEAPSSYATQLAAEKCVMCDRPPVCLGAIYCGAACRALAERRR